MTVEDLMPTPAEACAATLWALALEALKTRGQEAALAMLDRIEAGQAGVTFHVLLAGGVAQIVGSLVAVATSTTGDAPPHVIGRLPDEPDAQLLDVRVELERIPELLAIAAAARKRLQ